MPPTPAPTPQLPVLRTGLTDAEILDRLGKASKRGKLAGYHMGRPSGFVGDDVQGFWLEVFGQYFDRRLIVRARSSPETQEGVRVLSFENRVKRGRIIAFWAIMALSVWPGVLLVHSMMATYFGWYPRAMWVTCAWYLPISVVPVPWVWLAAWKKSSVMAHAEALGSIQKIAGHLGATLEA